MACDDCYLSHLVAEFLFFFFKIGESMLDPSIRIYIYQGVCFEQFPNDTTCYRLRDFPEKERTVQHFSANYIMYYKILLNLPAILLGLVCGAWSDKIGRKLPVMLTSFGTILAVMCYMLSMVVEPYRPYLPLVLVGAAIRGSFGKSAIMTMALHSYVSDMTTEDERTKKLGRLLSMNFFGYFIGSLATGALLQISSFDVIFCAAVFVNSICVLVSVLFMRESLSPRPQGGAATDVTGETPVGEGGDRSARVSYLAAVARKSPFSLSNVQESMMVLFKERPARGRCHLILLLLVIVMWQMCKSGETDVALLVVERAPLSWDKSLYGYLLATDYACLGLAVFVLLPLLLRFTHLDDMSLILVGVAFKILRLVMLACSNSTWMVFLSVVVGCPSAMVVSGVKSLVSKTVDENEMGKIFSLLSCAETISNLLGSVIFTAVYASSLSLFTGFTFALDAVAFVLAFFALLLLARDMKTSAQYGILQWITGGSGSTGNYGSACAATTSASATSINNTSANSEGQAAENKIQAIKEEASDEELFSYNHN